MKRRIKKTVAKNLFFMLPGSLIRQCTFQQAGFVQSA